MRFLPSLAILLPILPLFACVEPCSEESGVACTWAGVSGNRGHNGDGLDRRETWLAFVADLTFDGDGNALVSDFNNHMVRRIGTDGVVSLLIGTDYEGDGPPGETDRLPAGNPEGALATEVALNHPTDIEIAPDGTVILAAWHNHKLRALDPATGIVTVLTGAGVGSAGDDGPAWGALLSQPKALAIEDDGTIYTIDQRNERLRRIATDDDRTITTIAGTGTKGYSGDGGPAVDAEFAWDNGTTPIPSGSLALRGRELFVADSLNHRIRRIDLDTGMVDCVAGDGEPGHRGDGGDPLDAGFTEPIDIEFGPDGRLYVADTYNNVIRAIDFDAATVETVAGTGEACSGEERFSCFEEGEGGVPALDLRLNHPYGIAFDAAGALYIADSDNSRIVRIAP